MFVGDFNQIEPNFLALGCPCDLALNAFFWFLHWDLEF